MQSEHLFERALAVSDPWYVRETRFDSEAKTLTIVVDFRVGSRFAHSEVAGEHPVRDTQTKRYRHLNFFQHECFLEARVARVKLPDGLVRLVGESRHRVAAIAERYVELALEEADFSEVRRLTIDETSKARGH